MTEPIDAKPKLGLESGRMLMTQGEAAFHDFVVQQLEPALGRHLPQMEHAVRKLTAARQTTERNVLNQIDAVFEPGTITLVLGQPGSGKTTLMKVLSGQFPITKNVTIQGDIEYNGLSWKKLLPKLPQLSAYVPQTDTHFPSLSVQETLEFAHACCTEEFASTRGKELLSNGTPEQNQEALRMVEALYKHYPDVVIEQLGLETCRNTVIGNALKRGVSGGERRRVTLGEMEFGMKYATFMDEVTNGLDSAATFDIVCTQRDIAKKLHKTVVMALLQPAPEVFELFDTILLLNDGEVMYNGPREQAVPYFESLGFVCPPDRDVADFLMDLGTDKQYLYETKTNTGSPRLASEFTALFRQSETHQNLEQALEKPWSKDRLRDTEEHLSKISQFRQSLWASAVTLTRRHLTIAMRNTAFIRVRTFMVVAMGLVYGSTFYDFDPTSAQVALGVLYQTTMFLALGQASQMPVFVASRDIVQGYLLQTPESQLLPFAFVRIREFNCAAAAAAAESVVFGTFVYWMVGFVTEVGYYLLFLLCMILTNLALCAWFFALTAMSPNFNIAKPMSTFSISLYVLFAGFVVPRSQLPDFLVWIYWINPVSWCLRTLAVNQYRSPKFDVCVYDGEDYCAQYDMTMGEYSLSLYDVPSDTMWVWLGVLYLSFSIIFFIVLGSFILEYKRFDVTEAVAVVAVDGDPQEGKEQDGNPTTYVEVQTPRAVSKAVDMVVVDLEEQEKSVPVTLAFKDLCGYALPGTMTALMGSSGAGKTTLMDVIAGRKTGGTIKGEILLNGYPATDLAIRRCTGYCEQQDVHSEGATIREALTFSAFLRQDSSVSERAKLASVEECLDLLDMRAIADQIIRAQPSVLFLDEPTSGLDAHSAKVIMDGVRKVADSGRTVVCTIHQPSSDVFFLFDSLLLLKRGGEMVFFGELGNAEPDDRECGHLIDYFEAIPEIARLPEGQNPATWMLECIGAGVAGAGEKPLTNAAA
eukprot:jgi/Phyca11/21930/fgenesh1_pg.PHYCAscaffold_232_\